MIIISFANDSQLLSHFPPDSLVAKEVLARVESCCVSVKTWMTRNRLKLNDDKTEVLLCGPKARRDQIDCNSLQVGEASISFADSVRDLGLIIDSELSMVDHITSVVRNCYFQIRLLGKLRPLLTREAAASIAIATITSRLDYCNSVLWGLPATQLDRLQRVQNAAARIVTRTKRTEHITPVLHSLHWLPITKRIDHKILSLAYSCMRNTAPEYLSEIVPVYQPPRRLRSCSQSLFCLPSSENTNKKRSGARAFKNAVPKLWNPLDDALKRVETPAVFKKNLKTFLFSSDV